MNIKFSRAYSNGAEIKDNTLRIENGKFQGFGGEADLDLSAYRLFPGFVDIHTHGGRGMDCSKCSFEELNELSKYYASNGVSTVCMTTITETLENVLAAVSRIADRVDAGTDGANIGGIYLEGPYLSSKFRGAHAEELLRELDIDEIKKIIDAARGNLRVFALAPEKANALEAISYLTSNRVKVSLGHSAATMAEAMPAIDAGGKLLIHTYNAMAGLNHRNVGLLGSALIRDDVYCELICDMIHVCPEAIEIVLRCKGSDRVVLITDSIEPAGMPDGIYQQGGLTIEVKDGVARTTDTGALAGSSLRSNIALKNVVEILGVPVADAAKMLTINPARAIGLECEIGSLDAGKRAHLTALDDDYNVVLTMVDGKIVYDAR